MLKPRVPSPFMGYYCGLLRLRALRHRVLVIGRQELKVVCGMSEL